MNRNDQTSGRHRPEGVHPAVLPDLKAWLDGELRAPRLWLIRTHLLFCPACREEVKWLKRLGEDMRDLETAVPSPRLRARILAALPEVPPVHSQPEAGWRRRPSLRYGAVGALACATLAAAFILGRSMAPHERETPQISAVTRPAHSAVAVTAPKSGQGSDSVAVPTGVDPTSAEADRRFAQWMKDQSSRATVGFARNQANWKAFAARYRAAPAGRQRESLPLTLAVPDVRNAEIALADWARAVGGEATVHEEGTGGGAAVAPLVTPDAERPMVTLPAATAPARLITLRIPANRVGTLEPVLRRLGAWSRTQTEALPAVSSGAAAPSGSAPAEGPKNATVTRVDPAQEPGGPPASAEGVRTAIPGQLSSRSAGLDFTTVQLRLTALEAPLP